MEYQPLFNAEKVHPLAEKLSGLVPMNLRKRLAAHVRESAREAFPVPPHKEDFVDYVANRVTMRLDQIFCLVDMDGEEAAIVGDFAASAACEIRHPRCLTLLVMADVLHDFEFFMAHRAANQMHTFENQPRVVRRRAYRACLGHLTRPDNLDTFVVDAMVESFDFLRGAVKVIFVKANMEWSRPGTNRSRVFTVSFSRDTRYEFFGIGNMARFLEEKEKITRTDHVILSDGDECYLRHVDHIGHIDPFTFSLCKASVEKFCTSTPPSLKQLVINFKETSDGATDRANVLFSKQYAHRLVLGRPNKTSLSPLSYSLSEAVRKSIFEVAHSILFRALSRQHMSEEYQTGVCRLMTNFLRQTADRFSFDGENAAICGPLSAYYAGHAGLTRNNRMAGFTVILMTDSERPQMDQRGMFFVDANTYPTLIDVNYTEKDYGTANVSDLGDDDVRIVLKTATYDYLGVIKYVVCYNGLVFRDMETDQELTSDLEWTKEYRHTLADVCRVMMPAEEKQHLIVLDEKGKIYLRDVRMFRTNAGSVRCYFEEKFPVPMSLKNHCLAALEKEGTDHRWQLYTAETAEHDIFFRRGGIPPVRAFESFWHELGNMAMERCHIE